MVCNRCKMVVKDELVKLGLHPKSVELGQIEISKEINSQQKNQLNTVLQSFGFELIDDRKSQLIEKIKSYIVELVHYSEDQLSVKFSAYISKKLNHDYSYLSTLFSEVEGITIEKYLINQRIEKVKEMITYDQLSLSEIAYQLGYSSVAHLSSQFKKVTGLTPSHFKQVGENKRKPLDKV